MFAHSQTTLDTEVLALARSHLHSLFGIVTERQAKLSDMTPFPRVNVTIRSFGTVRGSMSGSGSTVAEQICNAVERAALDDRFEGPIVRADLAHISIEVWLQYESHAVNVLDAHELSELILGVYGVDVEQGTHFAYYKPSVSLTSSFTTPEDLLAALCRKADLPLNAWKDQTSIVRRTSWLHIAESEKHSPNRLVGLRKLTDENAHSRENIEQWLVESTNYLIANQNLRGEICYKYNPLKGEVLSGKGNPVRASGCAYALSESATYFSKNTSPSPVVNSAVAAINAILKRRETSPSGQIFIRDTSESHNKGGKLGTTALLVLALLGDEVSSLYKADADQLLAGIKVQQRNDGSLASTYGALEELASQANFFPGQALLACVVKSMSGDQSFRDVYQRSFPFYVRHFRQAPSSAFVGWHADVWSRAAILDDNEHYAAFVFEQIDWLLMIQLRDKSKREYGAFVSRDKSAGYSSLVYVEAIARAADLAYRLGNDKRYDIYRSAVHAGLAYCSLLRLSQEQSMFFPDSKRAMGGMTTTLTNFVVRSDVVQHAVTMMLVLLKNDHLL